ncbi:tetrapyrrole methylase family protein / MazG family protein [Caloramator quimbayensis]|uniref:Tetrapyrrole methylase family protein / MazG family protein n=1 Tax=Caloramator quimbayensis TaxID=1147123 RepID=A0A1T4Y0V8_9CLOT|nr:nucleoside triphosphate pyrophosphohydrolase [Caloramator quimbayensis]SKA95429.1 tetrapyrrole methylase family protein / MazG family protein [Caloramator quimbayensis]
MIKIVGLGPGSRDDLTLKCINVIKDANNLYLRTDKHPCVDYIKSLGVKFETFDSFYDKSDNFDDVYEKIARHIVNLEDVVYAVPGHPLVAEKSVSLILNYAKEKEIYVEVIPALSFVDVIVNALKVDPIDGLKIIDALQIEKQMPDINVGNIITQIYSKMVASDVKIKLMEYYSDEQEVFLIRAAGVKDLEKIQKMPLFEIDRVDWIDYLTSLYIPPSTKRIRYDMEDLTEVMKKLRSENGCPWDREQTHESLKRYLIEEAYEVIDAIDNDDMESLCEELGDVLLQVVFHSQIAEEFGEFNLKDVVHGITDKMIKRHTHVFGEDICKISEDVLQNWEKIKRDEKNIESYTDNLKAIPKPLPALLRSYKVQEKAAQVGFDWDKVDEAVDKVKEELNEFLQVYKTNNYGNIIEEIGDLLFAVVNVARFFDINPEFALTKTIEKFITRFEYIEKSAEKNGKKLEDMTLKEMDQLWDEAKNKKNNTKRRIF